MNMFILPICIISLAISICENLTSGTRLGKQIKFLLSLILLTVIFKPFSDGVSLPDIPEIPDITELEEYSQEFFSQETADMIAENISRKLVDELLKNNINTDFIETEINISDSDSISINRVTVGTDNFKQAEKIIKDNLGEETEVLNGYS